MAAQADLAQVIAQKKQGLSNTLEVDEIKRPGSGGSTGDGPPRLPHVTSNYVPLARIVSNLTAHALAELQTQIATLPSVTSDLVRKRRLLDYIVKTRQEFVRLYVLAKWAHGAQPLSTVIDIVSWLHGQQNCFTNVVNVLFEIERSLGGAKLRNPDLQTALEVLGQGQPQLDPHGFVTPKSVDPQTALRTLHDLNVLLSIRLALSETFPARYRDYFIVDGRVRFTVKGAFVCDFSVAEDAVDARFFLVDFNFCFAPTDISPSSPSATAAPASYTVPTPPSVRALIEHMCNDMLARQSLVPVLDRLLLFAQNYKLFVLNQQLLELEAGLWSGVVSHAFYADKSTISVQYWANNSSAVNSTPSTSSANPAGQNSAPGSAPSASAQAVAQASTQATVSQASAVVSTTTTHANTIPRTSQGFEIGIIKSSLQLGVRWIHHGISVGALEEVGTDQLSAETILKSVVDRHVAHIIERVFHELLGLLGNKKDLVSTIDRASLRLQLTPTRKTTYSIDTLTGRAVLDNPTAVVLATETSLNEVSDKASQSASRLYRLREACLQEELLARAQASGWTANLSVTVSSDDLRRYFGGSASSPVSPKSIVCLRQPSWPFRWHMVVVTRPDASIHSWWIAQLEARDGTWLVRYVEQIHIKAEARNQHSHQEHELGVDYKLLHKLAAFATERIKFHAIGVHLHKADVRYSLVQAGQPRILVDLASVLDKRQGASRIKPQTWAHSLLSLSLDTAAAILRAEGKTKRPLPVSAIPSDDASIRIDAQSGKFTVLMALPAESLDGGEGLMNQLVSTLTRIERVVEYTELITSLGLRLEQVSMSRVTFEYGDGLQATILLDCKPSGKVEKAEVSATPIGLQLQSQSPHFPLALHFQALLASQGLQAMIRLLQTTLVFYQELSRISQNATKDPSAILVVHQTVGQAALVFTAIDVVLDVSVRQHRGRTVVYVGETHNGKACEEALSINALWHPPSVAGAVPLHQGLACPMAQFSAVLDRILTVATGHDV